jgi:spore coat polysaccharide biosynthesis protein SpsF
MRHGANAGVSAVIQARMGSSRLPGKSMMPVAGQPALAHVIRRSRLARGVEEVYVATTTADRDAPIVDLCDSLSVGVYRGSEDDVLARFAGTVRHFGIDVVVRITGDNPLVGHDVIDYVVDQHFERGADMTSAYHSKTYPNGTIVSVIGVSVIDYLAGLEARGSVREHIVTGIDLVRERFVVHLAEAPEAWRRPDLRYCIDDGDDLLVVRGLCDALFAGGAEPTTAEVIRFLDEHDDLRAINAAAAARPY